MKQQIENIIKKNLPEKKGHDSIVQLGVYDQATTEGKLHYQNEYGKRDGFNQALSQINPSLIADEVLKVFREQIEDLPTLYNSIEHLISKDDILDLLDNLSPNKENKNNGQKTL